MSAAPRGRTPNGVRPGESTMLIVDRDAADAVASSELWADVNASAGTSRGTMPLYIVCSPHRGVGKTLIARLLVEFYLVERQTVAAFDLADEGPQLADFLPQTTTRADIGGITGQMKLFDRLVADKTAVNVIDVSHRTFNHFFGIAQKIGFFEEARRRGIDPLILYLIDPDPKSAKSYAVLRRWFPDTALLPVRNHIVAKGIPYCSAFLNASSVPVSLEFPVLGAAARALVEQRAFSFAKMWRAAPARPPHRGDEELRAWTKRVFLQFRELELWRICEDILAALAPPPR
jgi:hypothetical protein